MTVDLREANRTNVTKPSSQLSHPPSKCPSPISLVDSVSVLGASKESLVAPSNLSPLELYSLGSAPSELSLSLLAQSKLTPLELTPSELVLLGLSHSDLDQSELSPLELSTLKLALTELTPSLTDELYEEQEVKNPEKRLGDLDSVNTSNSPANDNKANIVIDFNKRLHGRLDVSGIRSAIKNKYSYLHEGLETKKSAVKSPVNACHSIDVCRMPETETKTMVEIPLRVGRRVAIQSNHGKGSTQPTSNVTSKSMTTTTKSRVKVKHTVAHTNIPSHIKKSSAVPRMSGRKYELNRRDRSSHDERRRGFLNSIYVQSNTPLSIDTISEYRAYSKIDIGTAIRSYAAVVKALFPSLGTFTKVGGVAELAGVSDVQLALYRLEKASAIQLQCQMPDNEVARNRLIRCTNYDAVELYINLLDEVAATVSKVTEQLARYYAGLQLPCCQDYEESATDALRNTAGLMICSNRMILKTFGGGKVVCRCRICDRKENCSCAVMYEKGMLPRHTFTDISYYFTLYIYLIIYILIFMNVTL